MNARSGGWWDTHDGAWRRARRLFALSAFMVTIYLAGIAVIVVLVGAALVTGDGDVVADWADTLGVLGVVLVVLALLAVGTGAITAVGCRGLPRRTRRLARARAPRPHEVDRIRATAASFGLAYGLRAPTVWVVDEAAPNAMAFGQKPSGHVAVTTGALELPPPELDALVEFQVTALTSRAYAYAAAAVDLVLLGEWLTRILWASGAFAIVSTIFGVPIDLAAVYVVAVAVLVLVTRPVILLVDRELIALLDEVDELLDLETIRHTNDPGSFASLLLTLVEDDRPVRSRWQVAHLWFERDAVTPIGRSAPDFVDRCERNTKRDLLARAAVAVDLADDEGRLARRLERARKLRPRRRADPLQHDVH